MSFVEEESVKNSKGGLSVVVAYYYLVYLA